MALIERRYIEGRLIEVAHTGGLGFPHQPVIEVRTIPVRVGDGVVGARGDEQLPRVRVVVGEWPSSLVLEEAEASLAAAGDVRIRILPGAPLRERTQTRQVVAIREFLDEQPCERGRGLADGKPRMATAFEQCHAHPALPQHQGQQRAGEPGADDGDVGVDAPCGEECHDGVTSPHASHASGGGMR